MNGGSPPEPLVVGAYALGEAIGVTERGAVHLARAAGLDRAAVVERVHPHLAADPQAALCIVDSARVARRIVHANVVRTLDVLHTHDGIYVVSEHIHGVPLSALTDAASARGEAMPVGVALAILTDVLLGLGAAHETCGDWDSLYIVHGSLSPDAILVGADGVARVSGFGVAPRGVGPYAAPEQATDGKVDRRADVYAMATISWELLTGQLATLGGILERPSLHNDAVSDAIDGVVLHGLEKNPRRRFASALHMRSALARYGTFATAGEVGRWVEQTASHVLEAHARVIASLPLGREATGEYDEERTTAPMASIEAGMQEIDRSPRGASDQRFFMGM